MSGQLGVVQIALAPAGRFCTRTADGYLGCQGAAGFETPPVPTFGVRHVVATNSDYCVLDEAQNVVCWAHGADVTSGTITGPATQLVAGEQHVCALLASGSVSCLGAGLAGTTAGTTPNFGQGTPPAGVAFRELAAGDWFTCGVRVAGGLDCWGRDTSNGGTASTIMEPPAGLE